MKLVANTKLKLIALLILCFAYSNYAAAKEHNSKGKSKHSYSYAKHGSKGSKAHYPRYKNKRHKRKSVVLGFPTHGTNLWYGEFIHDYSQETNYPLLVNGPWYQVGLLNPDGPREELPVFGSDLDRTLATTSEMVTNFIAPGLYDPLDSIFNKPFNDLGTLFFGSQGVFDRTPVVEHEVCDPTVLERSFCTREGAIQNPTLRDWNRARGRLEITHRRDGTDDVRVIMRSGLPQTMYSVWLVGVTDNFEPNPILTASPLGGIPNILITDKRGNASYDVTVNYPILKPCERGPGKGCQLYVSMVWHPDGAAYGGSPSIDFIPDPDRRPGTPGIPVGVVGSAQVFVPLHGVPQFDVRQIYRENR